MEPFKNQVDPFQLESFLSKHPHVTDAKIVNIPHPSKGEIIVAWIIPSTDTLTEQQVFDYCEEHLNGEENHPSYIYFTDEYPMTASGKIQKIRLREQALERINGDK
ncbi:AMP-binding enzyme [Alkalibacillus aidingensis]|uniref:AMP-binding enzyme n=1 Tax=Alkalibacillus aidingensis TaxID=2747607 RepID=UPI0016611DE1|nr:hypothetical protein [Alkalibacillus aidingensis]